MGIGRHFFSILIAILLLLADFLLYEERKKQPLWLKKSKEKKNDSFQSRTLRIFLDL
jgi:hypothetical protein